MRHPPASKLVARFVLLLAPLVPLRSQDAITAQAYVPNLTPLKRIEPVQADVAGMVRVFVLVDADGRVSSVEPLTGPEVLRKAAVEAVQQWRFQPVLRNGRAVAAYTNELLTFTVPGKPTRLGLNRAEEEAAANRTNALQKQFPRTPADVLADLEQDSSDMTDQERFYALAKLAKAAWEAGAVDKAASYAGELVSSAQQYPKDWNYGNAIHDGNSVLGLVALRGGNRALAGKYLLESGKTPGSPQLNSFLSMTSLQVCFDAVKAFPASMKIWALRMDSHCIALSVAESSRHADDPRERRSQKSAKHSQVFGRQILNHAVTSNRLQRVIDIEVNICAGP
jgi:TonB family protein